MTPRGPKMNPRWLQKVRRWPQDGPKMAARRPQGGPKMAPRWSKHARATARTRAHAHSFRYITIFVAHARVHMRIRSVHMRIRSATLHYTHTHTQQRIPDSSQPAKPRTGPGGTLWYPRPAREAPPARGGSGATGSTPIGGRARRHRPIHTPPIHTAQVSPPTKYIQ